METHKFSDGTDTFKAQQKTLKEDLNIFNKEIEKRFILDFIMSLPIDKLKTLINFELTDPFDDTIPRSFDESMYRKRLMHDRVVEFKASITI